MPEIIQVLCGK